MRSNEMTHLPSDVRDALNRYDDDVASGAIKFGPNGDAIEFPGKLAADAQIREMISSKIVSLV